MFYKRWAADVRYQRQNIALMRQMACPVPSRSILRAARLALNGRACHISLLMVDQPMARELNGQYRGKDYATNVLSFSLNEGLIASSQGDWASTPIMGDIVICWPVIEAEAMAQGKNVLDHCLHMVIHGVLHLQGYDHIQADEATRMETLEIHLLDRLGIASPYDD
jgi:probable rRNA maturation factor